jgi:hypothetical protein
MRNEEWPVSGALRAQAPVVPNARSAEEPVESPREEVDS